MARPLYEDAATKRAERRLVEVVRPKLRRAGELYWGSLVLDHETEVLAVSDHVMRFEQGTFFLEVKNRSSRFSTFMISESKIAELRLHVDEQRAAGRDARAFVLVTTPEPDGRRRVSAFNVEDPPVYRKMAGRDDRGDGIDREMCVFFDWDNAVDLGTYWPH
jgi:hypothetical protein